MPEAARFCPFCGHDISTQPRPSTKISADMVVGNVHDEGRATGIDLRKVEGDASIDSTVNQIENVLERGDYVDRRTIINVSSPEAMQEVTRLLVSKLEVSETPLDVPESDSAPHSAPLPPHASRQITEVIAAQKEMEAKGIPASSEALYDLGKLANYNRDPEQARAYFRQSYEADPENVAARRAFEILNWENCHYSSLWPYS